MAVYEIQVCITTPAGTKRQINVYVTLDERLNNVVCQLVQTTSPIGGLRHASMYSIFELKMPP